MLFDWWVACQMMDAHDRKWEVLKKMQEEATCEELEEWLEEHAPHLLEEDEISEEPDKMSLD